MATYHGEDAWLFAGDDFDGCGSCGQADCPGCDYQPVRRKPTTNITVLLTGGPMVLLFDTDPYKQFVVGASYARDIPTLQRYAEVWQRLTPQFKNSEPGLKIRLVDSDGKPATYEQPLSVVTHKFTVLAEDNKFFGLSIERGSGTRYCVYGTYRSQSWRLNLLNGTQHAITNLRVVDDTIRYVYNGTANVDRVDSIFDYGTGERVAHNPSAVSVMAKS